MEYSIWTRVGAEAGETTGEILLRKEQERSAGDGLFVWGVGNSSRGISALLHAGTAIDVVFSCMRARPRPHDVSPATVIGWRAYVDDDKTRPLPAHVRVTSRGGKDRHYALICRSNEPLVLSDRGAFDPEAHRNLSGRRIGDSQVTALVQRVARDSASTLYASGFRARLVDWVKLAQPTNDR